MNENIDLRKILKDCPTGFKLYSLLHGEVSFRGIDETNDYPIRYNYTITSDTCISIRKFYLTSNGTYSNEPWRSSEYLHEFIDEMCHELPEILNLEWKGVEE